VWEVDLGFCVHRVSSSRGDIAVVVTDDDEVSVCLEDCALAMFSTVGDLPLLPCHKSIARE